LDTGKVQYKYILFCVQYPNAARLTNLNRGQTILHSNTTDKTEILYFVLKMTQFKNFGFSSSVIGGTTHAYNPNKRHIKLIIIYEGRLISNAQSEIFRQRDLVFKQTKVGSQVQYFSYKLTYLFFDIVALSFNKFFPNVKQVYACRQ